MYINMKYNPTHILVFLFFYTALAAQPTRYYVDQQASGQNTGTSWTNAFTNLHDALALSIAGDEIWVAEGKYRPSATTDRNAHFELASGVRLLGSFAATELSAAERDIAAHPSFLDGDIGVQGDSLDNSYNLLYLFHPDENTLVDGFHFQYGQSDKSNSNDGELGGSGAGLLIMGYDGIAFPTIRHCVFEHNYAQYDGGAVFVNGGGTGQIAPKFEYCRFSYNKALYRGACIARKGGLTTNNGIDFYRCEFSFNAIRTSGAVYLYSDIEGDTIDFVQCTFRSNIHGPGNGTPRSNDICIIKFTTNNIFINIDSCEIRESGKKNNLFINGSSSPIGNDPVFTPLNNLFFNITNTQFIENNGVFYWEGVDEDLDTTNQLGHLFLNNRLVRNRGTGIVLPNAYKMHSDRLYIELISSGMGIYVSIGCYRAIYNTLSNSSIFVPNYVPGTIINDFPKFYFGGPPDSEPIRIINSTIQNLALIISGQPKFLVIENTIFDNNGFENFPSYRLIQGFDQINNFQVNFHNNLSNKPLPSYAANWNMSNNQWDTNPLFIAPDSNDLRLQPCSPAINTGNNGYVLGSTDLSGQPRIQYGNVDLGAYEMGKLEYNSPPVVLGACKGASSGSIDLSGIAACPPVTYLWSQQPAASQPVLSDLSPGTYTATITDSKSRTTVTTLLVPEKAAPVLSPVMTPVICGTGAGGTASFLVASTAFPLQYAWNNQKTDSLLSNIPAGFYAATVTDVHGCSSTNTVQVTTTGTLTIGFDFQDITCYGANDGEITILPGNAAPPFQWAWDDGTTFPGISGLSAGNYRGTLTDGFGCSINWQVSVTDPLPIEVTAQITPTSTNTATDGQIDLIVSGGTGNLDIDWQAGATGPSIDNLSVGFYTVTITDSQGCTKELVYEVKSSVGTQDNEPGKIQLLPNPFSDHLTLTTEMPDNTPLLLVISDFYGRTKAEIPFRGHTSQVVRADDWASGVYFWRIIREGNTASSGRIVRY